MSNGFKALLFLFQKGCNEQKLDFITLVFSFSFRWN